MLNKIISFELSKLLNNTIYCDLVDNYYAAEDVEVTFDNYLGVKKFQEGDLIDDGDSIHGKYYYAPYISEVLDKLLEYGFIVEFIPCFTFALATKVAYFYKVYKINKETAKLDLLFEENEWFSSRDQALQDIFKKLIDENIITV